MSSENCLITHRPDLATLVARWQDDAPVPALQADFQHLLTTSEAYGTTRWLLDVRRRAQLNPELGAWTTTDFYPRAAAVLAPPMLRIAVLCSPARLAVYGSSAEQMDQLAFGMNPARPYRLQLFGDEGAAMNWLLTQ